MFGYTILKFQTFCFKVSYVINNLLKSCEKWDSFLSHCTCVTVRCIQVYEIIKKGYSIYTYII